MEGGHASSACTTTWRKDISDVDILDKCRVEVNPSVDCTQNAREDFLWACVFKTTALALSGECQQGKWEVRESKRTLVIAERTAATMTTSLSFFVRTAALPEGKVGDL